MAYRSQGYDNNTNLQQQQGMDTTAATMRPHLQEAWQELRNNLDIGDGASTVSSNNAQENIYAKNLVLDGRNSILICQPVDSTNVKCLCKIYDDANVEVNVEQARNSFKVQRFDDGLRASRSRDSRAANTVFVNISARSESPTLTPTSQAAVNRASTSSTQRVYHLDYTQGRVPSANLSHVIYTRDGDENTETATDYELSPSGSLPSASDASYIGMAQVAMATRRAGRPNIPTEHMYDVLAEEQNAQKLSLTLQKITDEQGSVEDILKTQRVARFIMDEGNTGRIDMEVCSWQYMYDEGSTINQIDWYHGNIGKEEAKRRLEGKPTGTFLVREATRRRELEEGAMQEFTLEVVNAYGNIAKLMIMKKDSTYNFSDSSETRGYNDVVSLIQKVIEQGLEFRDTATDEWTFLTVIPLRVR